MRLQMGSFDIQKLVVGRVLDADKTYTVEWTADGIRQPDLSLKRSQPSVPSALFPIGTAIELDEFKPIGGLHDGDLWLPGEFAWETKGEPWVHAGATASFTIERNTVDSRPAVTVRLTNTVARLPELPTLPLPFTGANAVPAALAGVAIFLLGVGGLLFAARVRRMMGQRG